MEKCRCSNLEDIWEPAILQYWATRIGKDRYFTDLEQHVHFEGQSSTRLVKDSYGKQNRMRAILGLIGYDPDLVIDSVNTHSCFDCQNLPIPASAGRREYEEEPELMFFRLGLLDEICKLLAIQEEAAGDKDLSSLRKKLDRVAERDQRLTLCHQIQFYKILRRMRPYTQLNIVAHISHYCSFKSLKEKYKHVDSQYNIDFTATAFRDLYTQAGKLSYTAAGGLMTWDSFRIFEYLIDTLLPYVEDMPIADQLINWVDKFWPTLSPWAKFGQPRSFPPDCARLILRIFRIAGPLAYQLLAADPLEKMPAPSEKTSKGLEFCNHLGYLVKEHKLEAVTHHIHHNRTFTGDYINDACTKCDAIPVFRTCFTEIMKVLPERLSYWESWSDRQRHVVLLKAITELVHDQATTLEELDTAVEGFNAKCIKWEGAMEKAESSSQKKILLLTNKVTRLEQDIRFREAEAERTAKRIKEHTERRDREQTQALATLTSKLAVREKELQQEKTVISKVKTEWSKKLQALYDKVSLLEQELQGEKGSHESTQRELVKSQQKVNTARMNWDANLVKYNTMKLENERLKAKELQYQEDVTHYYVASMSRKENSIELQERAALEAKIEEMKISLANKESQLATQKASARQVLEVKEENIKLQARLALERPSNKTKTKKNKTTKLEATLDTVDSVLEAIVDQQELTTQKELVKTLAEDLEELKGKNMKLEARVACEVALTFEQLIKISRLEGDLSSKQLLENQLAVQQDLVLTLTQDLERLSIENRELRKEKGTTYGCENSMQENVENLTAKDDVHGDSATCQDMK